MKNPLIIISFDGLATEDIEYLKDKPGFARFLDEASGSSHVKSIYPSVTYAAHASISTGCYPIRHGIIDNTKVQPERYQSPDWFWYRKDIAVETIYDIAKRNGYSVAALLWPTTGKANIDYNMPEIFSNRKWTSQLMVSLYAGSPIFQANMDLKHGKLRDGKNQPALDNFTHAVMLSTIREHQPDLMLVHFTDLDSIRHLHGHSGPEAFASLDRHDIRLNSILDTLGELEKYNHAHIVILGDHSSIDVTHGISINSKLIEWGYLKQSGDTFSDIKAMAKSCDGSSYLYVYDDDIKAELIAKLAALQREHSDAFDIVKHEDIVKMGADPKAFVMLEAKPPYHFVEDVLDHFIDKVENIPYYKGKKNTAVHGFSPLRPNYDTVFYLRGPKVKPGEDLGEMSLVDIAPTLAHLMDWQLNDVDGDSKYLMISKS